MAKHEKNKGVFVCKGRRVHVVYNDITLHFDFDEFEKFTFMLDDAYHRIKGELKDCLLYTSPSPRDRTRSRMPSSA